MRLPLGAPISHAEALQHCKELAAKLLQRSTEQQSLPPGAPPTTPLTCEFNRAALHISNLAFALVLLLMLVPCFCVGSQKSAGVAHWLLCLLFPI
jgi:hypothetical protein